MKISAKIMPWLGVLFLFAFFIIVAALQGCANVSKDFETCLALGKHASYVVTSSTTTFRCD